MRLQRLLGALALVLAVVATEAKTSYDFEYGVDIDTNYVFRGAERGPAGLTGNVGVIAGVGHGVSLRAGLWQYYQLSNEVGFGESKYHLGAVYRPPLIGWLGWLEGGWIYYDNTSRLVPRITFPGDNTGGRDTQEWYLRARFKLPGDPTIDLLQDFDQRTGTYLKFNAGKEFNLPGRWSLGVNGSVGLDFGRGVDTWRDAKAQASLFYDLVPGLKLQGTVDLWIPSNQVDPTADGLTPVFSFGIVGMPTF